jgi:hypothetical protein
MGTEKGRGDPELSPLREKKPYEKPSFRCEKVFVTSALTCGKITSSDDNCRGLNIKVS